MCYVVLRQLLIVVFIFTVEGTSLTKIDLSRVICVPKCKFPQPRSVLVAQEIQIIEDTLPYMTTLHRCDEGSGCCKTKGEICKLANWDVLNATIYVKDQQTNKYVKRYFEIRNHTECSCQNFRDTPK